MAAYKYQSVAKARIRKNDPITFRMGENGDLITGKVSAVSGIRNSNGAYTQVCIGGRVENGFYAQGKWYETEIMIVENHLNLQDEGMCHLMVTYHMKKNHGTIIDPAWEDAESCIMLPMPAEVADDVLQNGAESVHVERKLCGGGALCEALIKICALQGYDYIGFCSAELVFLSDFVRDVR